MGPLPDYLLNAGLIARDVVIRAALLGPHHGVEFFRVEIAEVDGMPGLLQAGERLGADRGVKGLRKRVAEDVVDFHSREPSS